MPPGKLDLNSMTLRQKLGIAAIALLAVGTACWFAVDDFRGYVYLALRGAYFAVHPVPARCKERAAEFQARVELIQRDAKNSLKVGAKKDDVTHFFASENIPLTIDQIGQDHEASGTVYFKGLAECENFACGDDSSLIRVQVKVDINGTVVSDPVVIGIYTDCL
jgi:hypothetical protein